MGISHENGRWKNNRRVRQDMSTVLKHIESFVPPNNEILFPDPGMLFIGKDLVADPVDHEITLHPEGREDIRISLKNNKQWAEMFKLIKKGEMKGGIHLRSNAAQAQIDIEGWKFAQNEDGGDNYDEIIVTLTNQSSDEAFIEAHKEFKLGNPFCYQTPLQGDELQTFAKQIQYAPEEKGATPTVLSVEDSKRRNFESTDESLLLDNPVIEIPLAKKHRNVVIHKRVNLTTLESGTDRDRLHKNIEIHNKGEVTIPQGFAHEPNIQLTSTPILSMTGGTALLLKACVKDVDGVEFLVPHSASNVHRSEAVEAGTSQYKPGETYAHSVIIESYNDIYPQVYPKSVLCEAFNMQVI